MVPELSIVIPVRNESPNIKPLYDELTQTLVEYGRPYEMLVIDDGSTDDTFDQLAALQPGDPRLHVIRFRRNFGQTAAFAAGIAHARGRLIVTADGDLQNDPRDIPAMVALIDQGNDIVCGWRKDRKDTFVTRRVPSVIASKLGVTIAEMIVNHRPRRAGVTKYGLSRTIRVVLDLATVKFLLNYSTRPLQIFGLVGIIAGGVGSLIVGYLGYVRLFQHQGIADRPLLLLGVMLLFIGVQLVTFGLLAELMARTYYESQDKATYVIREIRESTDLATV